MVGHAVRELTVGDGLVVVHEAGPAAGPRLLVLHDAGAETVDAPAWEDLAADHRVVQVLLPGYRRSTPPPAGAGIGWVTDHLAAVMDALCWADAHVTGTSLGGWFAIELALAHPGRVTRLTLCDPAGLQQPQAYLLALFADGRAAHGTERIIEQTLLAHLPRAQRDVAAMPPALAVATMAPYLVDMAAAALSSWNPWVPSPSMLRRAAAIDVPTTIMWGERDALIPLDHGRALAGAVPSARLVVVPGAGHLLPVTHPAHVVAQVRG
ncbi:alpha/beta fold hydrolase [soil metagenome]